MASVQHALFHELPRMPEGFRYEQEFLRPDEERTLISTFEHLPFREFEFRDFLGKRRTVSFGWRYDFNVLQPTETIPTFLLALRSEGGAVCRAFRRCPATCADYRVFRWRSNRVA